MNRAELKRIYDALAMAWAYMEIEYEAALKSFGADDCLTQFRERSLSEFRTAIDIVNRELKEWEE